MLESVFKSRTLKEIETEYPGCLMFKTDIPGFPDTIILYKNKWAALEFKKARNSKRQPNQTYFVELMDEMSFAAFIHPDNKEEVLDDLQQTLAPRRRTRRNVRK